MKSFRSRFRISSRTIRQTLGAAGVIISLVFVGMQIRESNIPGACSGIPGDWDFDRGIPPRLQRPDESTGDRIRIPRGREAVERIAAADLRMLEMIQLQVEQGLLTPDAVARLGYNWGPILSNPAMACMWPELRTQVGSSVRKLIEDSTPAADRVACQVDLQALRDETILGRKKDTTGASATITLAA